MTIRTSAEVFPDCSGAVWEIRFRERGGLSMPPRLLPELGHVCGIVGIASRHPIADRSRLAIARDTMRHRGPDDAGEWWSADGRVGLAQRRLSIIDLSPAGHQPMLDASGDLAIVFNGEIYNFQDLRAELTRRGVSFRSSSDTEVILAAYREWDVECLARLNGMFAFALYDAARRRLFVARDRAGEKPLFYAVANGTIRFASELKALLADPAFDRRIDTTSLDCLLSMGFVPGDRCILAGVNKLPPAHALLFDLETGEHRVWRYWEMPAPPDDAELASDTELLDEFEALLEDAVRRQLVADVPVGVLLSGGVDSSLVTAMAARTSSRIKTFTVRFPGHGRFDETEHARLVARHFGTEHIELEAHDATPELLPTLARQLDEPMIDSSIIPTHLVSRLVREHCTVALGGDGGDELFGGYHRYSRMLWTERRLGGFPRAMRSPVAALFDRSLPLGFRGRSVLTGAGVDFMSETPHLTAQFPAHARRALLPFVAGRTADEIFRDRAPKRGDALQRITRMDFENYMAEDILVKVDRASMLTSLEVRAPLLDYRIIEFAYGRVPSRLKATTSERKVLMKALCARVLPPKFDRQRKQGFSIPLRDWLKRDEWQEFFRELLVESEGSIFDKRTVSRMLNAQRRGLGSGEPLFGLAMFELWRRHYGARL